MTQTYRSAAVLILLLHCVRFTAAQSSEEALRTDLLNHFNQLSSKVTQLSEAIPADLYDWAPGEDVMSVGHVLAHIAHYNYMYLDENLGIPAPPDTDLETMERVRDRERVVPMLAASVEHVRNHLSRMTKDELSSDTRLYGSDVKAWAVIVQLVSHLGEHTGQMVAYARMNGIVPPWSS